MSETYQFTRRERVALSATGLRQKADEASRFSGRVGRVVSTKKVPVGGKSKQVHVYVKVRWAARGEGDPEFTSEELANHLQISVPEVVRLTPDEFLGEFTARGWDKRSLMHRWGYTSVRRVDQLINDTLRPAYFDDAVMNLPRIED